MTHMDLQLLPSYEEILRAIFLRSEALGAISTLAAALKAFLNSLLSTRQMVSSSTSCRTAIPAAIERDRTSCTLIWLKSGVLAGMLRGVVA